MAAQLLATKVWEVSMAGMAGGTGKGGRRQGGWEVWRGSRHHGRRSGSCVGGIRSERGWHGGGGEGR
eukprot:365302-Chlamydomonas_euryale.AAC.6